MHIFNVCQKSLHGMWEKSEKESILYLPNGAVQFSSHLSFSNCASATINLTNYHNHIYRLNHSLRGFIQTQYVIFMPKKCHCFIMHECHYCFNSHVLLPLQHIKKVHKQQKQKNLGSFKKKK